MRSKKSIHRPRPVRSAGSVKASGPDVVDGIIVGAALANELSQEAKQPDPVEPEEVIKSNTVDSYEVDEVDDSGDFGDD